VAIAARRHVFFANQALLGVEVDDRELLDFPLAALDVVLTNRKLADHTIAELAAEYGRGVRDEADAAAKKCRSRAVVLNRGDVWRSAAPRADRTRRRALGYIDRPLETDMCLSVSAFPRRPGWPARSLSPACVESHRSGGALTAGVFTQPGAPDRPHSEPTWRVFDTIGLATFIGVVGLSAGDVRGGPARPVESLIAAFFVAVIPHTAALVGRYVLKMNPVPSARALAREPSPRR
jgi:putative transport protein